MAFAGAWTQRAKEANSLSLSAETHLSKRIAACSASARANRIRDEQALHSRFQLIMPNAYIAAGRLYKRLRKIEYQTPFTMLLRDPGPPAQVFL